MKMGPIVGKFTSQTVQNPYNRKARYYSGDEIKGNGMGGVCCMCVWGGGGRREDAYMVLVEGSGRRPLGRPWRRWEDNLKMELKYVERAWTGSIWLRKGGCCEHGNEPSIKCEEFSD
jgi:hypothetical protein